MPDSACLQDAPATRFPTVSGLLFAVFTVLGMSAFTLVLRATLQLWPVGLAGACSRVVTLAVLAAWLRSRYRDRADFVRALNPRGQWAWLLLMGVISNLINLLLFAALQWTTPTNHALIFRLDLVFVVLIGGVLGLERLTFRQLLLLPCFLLGIALVAEAHKLDFHGHLTGDVMVLLAAFGFATNAFVIKRILRSMKETVVAFYNHGMSTLGFVALATLQSEWSTLRDLSGRWTAWLWVTLLGLVVAVTLPLYYAALKRMAVWKLRAYLLLVPVVVGWFDWLVWGTRLSAAQAVGAALILFGLACLIREELREQPADGVGGSEREASEGVARLDEPTGRLAAAGQDRREKA